MNLIDKSRYTFYWNDETLPYADHTLDWRKWPRLDEHNKHRAIDSHKVQEPEFYKVFDDTYFDFITETLTTNEMTVKISTVQIQPQRCPARSCEILQMIAIRWQPGKASAPSWLFSCILRQSLITS